MTGARHQGQFGLHTLNLPGLLWQRGATELDLNLGVTPLREEEVFVVGVDAGRPVHTESHRVAAAGGDHVGGLAEVFPLVLVPHLLQPDGPLVADGDGPPGGVLDPPVGGGGAGLGLAAELQAGPEKLVHRPCSGRD